MTVKEFAKCCTPRTKLIIRDRRSGKTLFKGCVSEDVDNFTEDNTILLDGHHFFYDCTVVGFNVINGEDILRIDCEDTKRYELW